MQIDLIAKSVTESTAPLPLPYYRPLPQLESLALVALGRQDDVILEL